MAFFNSAIDVLKLAVTAIGGGVGVLGIRMENKGIEMSLEELLEFIRESGDSVMVSFTVEKEGEDGQ